MKCDELKDRWFTAYPTDGICKAEVYGKKEVDEAIAELKDEIYNQKWRGDEWARNANDKDKQIDELKDENRKLRRALWLARAYIMTLLSRDFQRLAYQCNNDDYKKNLLRRRNRYYDLSEKCIKKAEEY